MVSDNSVLELPGLYGPFTFPEKLLQKIWMRREFDETRAVTTDGRRVTVIHPGKWNLLGGPDFKNARLRLDDGPEITGDVELHLHAADWAAHRHARDPAYDNVVLHVVLFAPAADHVTVSANNVRLPVLALLPLLHHDLEEYAADDAVELMANRPAAYIVEVLGLIPLDQLRSLLVEKARTRWWQKVRYARLRIERLGWSEACHQTALEILGYRFNRAPMLKVAAEFPLPTWCDATLDLDIVFGTRGKWSLQGLRPANHPRVRLRQYWQWMRVRPDWPERLLELRKDISNLTDEVPTAEVRRSHELSGLRRMWNKEITDGEVGGTRFDNLVCDGFLPLLTAKEGPDLRQLWFHWFTGDVPPLWRQALRQLDVFAARSWPASHGITQGLLGWLIERERSAGVSAGRSA